MANGHSSELPKVELSPILAVIPARFASTRYPGKIIAPLAGKPLVLHAYERALEAELVSEAVIATDDERVVEALQPYGARVMMTRTDHACGTDRIAEVAAREEAPIIVNLQGDEPLMDPRTVDAAVRPLLEDETLVMSTARRRIEDPEEVDNPNVVKVVCDASGKALYFSRLPIPCVRDEVDRQANPRCHWQHLGLYVYRRDFLLQYSQMEQTPLELLEKLEQLRVLERGYRIAVIDTDYEAVGVDTPEDMARVRAILEPSEGEGKEHS